MAEEKSKLQVGLETFVPLALGVGGAPRGALEGIRDREGRELRSEARADRAENREFMRKQRQFESEEMEYKRSFLDYTREMDRAISKFIMTDGEDVQPAVNVFNSRYPGANIQLEKASGKKGETRYNITGTIGGKSVNVKNLGKEQVLERLHLTKDPDTWMANQRDVRKTKASQKFEMEKLKEEYHLKGHLVETKAKATGYTRGSAAWKRVQDLHRALTGDARKIIQQNYAGTFEGGVWFPDETNREVALNAMQIAADKVKVGTAPDQAAREAIEEANSGYWPKSAQITKTVGGRKIKQVGLDTSGQPMLVDAGAAAGADKKDLAPTPKARTQLPEDAQSTPDSEDAVRPGLTAKPASRKPPKGARARQAATIAGNLVDRYASGRKELPKSPQSSRQMKMGGRAATGRSAWKSKLIGIRDDIMSGIEYLSPAEQEKAAELVNEINRQLNK